MAAAAASCNSMADGEAVRRPPTRQAAPRARRCSGRCGARRRQERNERGGFFRVFQHNKWRARKQAAADAARAAAPVPA